ncbi:MAG: DUF11 domain-containing protein [Calditrichaeota bacterium]|nr:MAG: DUF11 domain-containing protein [Calditrichota bacterium]
MGAAFQVTFQARVTQTPPTLPVDLVNRTEVQTASEVDDSDNSASAVVKVIPRRADLAVTKTATPDSVLKEEPFAFALTVTNQGPNTAFDVTLSDFLPPGVTAFGFDSPPDQTAGDTLRWHLDSLAVGAAFQVSFQARVTQPPPSLPTDLVNRGLAQTDFDTDGSNNSAVAVVKVIPRRYDLVLVQTATPDSIPKQGQFSARLKVENRGPDTAFDVQVRDILPEHATAFDFNVDPRQTTGDTLSWHLDSLAVGETFQVAYSGRAARDIPFTPFHLMARGTVEAAFDVNRANNSDEAVVVVLPSDDCLYLDRNVFLPERGTPLKINFEIGSDRFVRLDLYDVSGEHVSDLAKTDFSAGTHTYAWDGRNQDGKEVGSGVYLITLRAGNLICWTKVIVVR